MVLLAAERLTGGLDVAQRGDARKHQVGQRLAQRQAGHGLGVNQALWRRRGEQRG